LVAIHRMARYRIMVIQSVTAFDAVKTSLEESATEVMETNWGMRTCLTRIPQLREFGQHLRPLVVVAGFVDIRAELRCRMSSLDWGSK